MKQHKETKNIVCGLVRSLCYDMKQISKLWHNSEEINCTTIYYW